LATLDPAAKRKRIERLSSIREIVFGVQDGILTTAGVLCGLSGAVSQRNQVILAALASTAAGALSMGAGAYLGTKAEAEVLHTEIKRTREEIVEEPYVVQENLLEALAKEGVSREAGYRIVKLLSSAPKALTATAEEKLYGIVLGMAGDAIADGLFMGIAFLIGALVPLLPFVFIASLQEGLIAAVATTAVALFAVGYFTGWMAERSAIKAGANFVSVAVGAAVAGYVIGLGIAKLGGLPSLAMP
jgi:VIT1/CCC1 family predicted Fe2+/Mn2+ transporter